MLFDKCIKTCSDQFFVSNKSIFQDYIYASWNQIVIFYYQIFTTLISMISVCAQYHYKRLMATTQNRMLRILWNNILANLKQFWHYIAWGLLFSMEIIKATHILKNKFMDKCARHQRLVTLWHCNWSWM